MRCARPRFSLWRRAAPVVASPEKARARLAELVGASGEEYAALSRLIGRPPHYLGRHVRDGSPQQLRDDERALLALYFRVDARELGAVAKEG